MGRLSWIIWVGPKCNHMYPYKREAERDFTHTHTHTHTEEDKVTREAETGVMRPQAKEFWQLEAGGDMEWILL